MSGGAHNPRPGRPRIAFFSRTGGGGFLEDIMAHSGRAWDVRVFQGKTMAEMTALMDWCDVAWFEWCDAAVVKASHPPKRCRIVCRLHSFEAFGDVPSRVAWEHIDMLIFVAPHVRDIVRAKVPDLDRRVATRVIPNGVNLDRFTFRDRARGHNIAAVGYINHKKNPSLLLQCIRALVDADPRFVLHVAGRHQEERFMLYVDYMIQEMGLADHVVFHGWVDDVDAWMADKHFLISTSVFESFGYGIAEAMATGAKPLIHNFPGARLMYPGQWLFNTVAECVRMTLNEEYRPLAYRRFIDSNYRLSLQLRRIDEMLDELMSRP